MTLLTRRAVAHKVLNSGRFDAEPAVVADHAGKPLTVARNEASIALAGVVAIGELDHRPCHSAQPLH